MIKKTCFILLIISILFAFEIEAQEKTNVRYWQQARIDSPFAYNFFIGKDANLFKTTISGFGSGFILDLFSGRFSLDIVTIGNEKINLSCGLGIAINKYKFSQNLIFEKTNNQINVFEDPDSEHDYVNKFFGYGKSKLVTGTLFAPINLNIWVDKYYISFSFFFDYYLSGKHKRKFFDENEKHEIIVTNKDFKNFCLNKEKIGIGFMISQNPKNISLGFTYMLTPFFQENKGPAINEVRISFKYTLKNRPFKTKYNNLYNRAKREFEIKQV
ncbi:MAG: hypothetical protein HN704_05045 [Bacteroidetes bacterium]|jgi:hypothetical protein|nr:hypothetical protein [Bacteroidota bacterium]MBT6685899.1 hypothetical protein [Bacteroidota bacterium]MBT7144037.1 hypothetical protein [Bacteroidota bacterium]MBT7490959.1 hypothetical protein [Bacteroidota bacterium]